MTTEDVFAIRALLTRMKLEAHSPQIDRLSDEIMTLVAGGNPLPPMVAPSITWVGNTMVVG